MFDSEDIVMLAMSIGIAGSLLLLVGALVFCGGGTCS